MGELDDGDLADDHHHHADHFATIDMPLDGEHGAEAGFAHGELEDDSEEEDDIGAEVRGFNSICSFFVVFVVPLW